MNTETKVIGGIGILTALVIIGGVFLFSKNNAANAGPKDYSQYVEKNLTLDPVKVSRDYNPKVIGQKSSTQATSTQKSTGKLRAA